MKTTIYFVAVCYKHLNPTIVETFDNKIDAETYASILCRTKKRKYIVLEQITEWDGEVLN